MPDQPSAHGALADDRVVLAALVAARAAGRPWVPLPQLCEAVAAVRGLAVARPATLAGVARLVADGHARCRVTPPGRRGAGAVGAHAEVRLADGPELPAETPCRISYAGDGRWRADTASRSLQGLPDLEEAAARGAELLRP